MDRSHVALHQHLYEADRSLESAFYRSPDRMDCGERGMVYRSTDSGFTWTEQGAIAKASLFGLSFPTRSEGWASGGKGTIVHLSLGR